VQKTEKEKVIADLTERLRSSETLIVADYRGLTNSQLVGLRASLRSSGAKLQVVKNTLTRRAAEAAGAEALLTLLEGPTAIAFVESDGDPVAVAKALADVAKETKVLTLRGGVLAGRTLTEADVEELAKLPPEDVVKSQLVGVIVAPLTQLLGLLEAPVRDLVGLLDARITQLEEGMPAGADVPEEQPAVDETSAEATPEPEVETPSNEASSDSDEDAETE
jgi:large subunit ribosomal protein L10